MKFCHEKEHLRRAKIAEEEGDHKRVEAERQRAKDNKTGKYKEYYD